MELGARLRQARLDAGLSQRQLCGETITRNMLSQIENGNARPSMDTLRYLAAQLGKPISYFLEETVEHSPNQALMTQARNATGQAVLELLAKYQEPDELFDRERWLLEALTCLELARQALDDEKKEDARTLLAQAETAGANTTYYTPQLEQYRQLLAFEALAGFSSWVGFSSGAGAGSGFSTGSLWGRGVSTMFSRWVDEVSFSMTLSFQVNDISAVRLELALSVFMSVCEG